MTADRPTVVTGRNVHALRRAPSRPGEKHTMSASTPFAAPRQGTGPGEAVAAAQFAVPPIPPWYVRRERLLDLLDTSTRTPLVLVTAPAGSGKTALVADWVHRRLDPASTAWVTAKEPDDAPAPLLHQALARTAGPVQHPRAARRGPEQRTLTAITDAVAAAPGRLTLVLDGFELASTATAGEVQALLDLSGEALRVVLLGRVDPVLPLYRYRLSDRIVEIRAADLAFTPAEARELFTPWGVNLSDEEVGQVLARTRGWAAALRFSARAVARTGGRPDALAGMEAATADINEYLLGEVLNTQPQELREFLLRTSVAEVLHPELVEELVGRVPLLALEDLARLNAFVEPTGPGTGTGPFRYAPLFRDLLRAQLAYEEPERMAELQRRTGCWHVRQGLVRSGLPYLVASRAWDQAAAAVVESGAFVDLLLDGAEGQYAALLRDMPDDLDTAVACVVRAALAWLCDDHERCARELGRVNVTGHGGSQTRIRALTALLAALHGRDAEPPDRAVTVARTAGECVAVLEEGTADVPADLGALARYIEGVALLRLGRVAEARRALSTSVVRGGQVHPLLRAEGLGYLAVADAVLGRLTQGERNAVRSLAAADLLPSWARRPAAAELALTLVELERYDLDRAGEHLGRSVMSSRLEREPVFRALRSIAAAGLSRGRGELSLALAKTRVGLLELARHDRWLTDRLHLETARLLVATGSPDQAHGELAAVTSRPEAELVAARALLAAGDESAASECLDGVPRGNAPLGLTVDRLLTDAARLAARDAPVQARQAVSRGLQVAVRERMRRPFREAPPSVRRMLAHDPALIEAARWVHHDRGPVPLAARSGSAAGHGPAHASRGSSTSAHSPAGSAPVAGNLTTKELEVLARLAELLSTEEIAAAMFVSVNTVRTHVRSILRKLRVSRRNAAVRRARELGLLDALPPHSP
jgi:LuxR family transcriptional regulator, maltose regulon positive regulatory protein